MTFLPLSIFDMNRRSLSQLQYLQVPKDKLCGLSHHVKAILAESPLLGVLPS